MRLSVALCTYNGSIYLRQQLESIAAQSRLPDELIICDDRSTDNTLSIIERFSGEVPFSVEVHQNNSTLGVAKNFEQAIDLCTGDIIVLCDQDDIWLSHKLQKIEAFFQSDVSAGMTFSDADVIDEDGRWRGYSLWQSVRFNLRQQHQMLASAALPILLKHPVVTGATSAFRSEYRKLFKPVPAEWIHDEWIALIISCTSVVKPIQEKLGQYRTHQKNQVGAEGTALAERIRTALRTNPQVYQKRAGQFRQLRDHIIQILPQQTELVRQLEEKIDHLDRRGNLPVNPIARIPKVFQQFIKGNYARYSASNLNALRDLLLRHEKPGTK